MQTDSLEDLEKMKGARPAHEKVLRDWSFDSGTVNSNKQGSSGVKRLNENQGTSSSKKPKKIDDQQKNVGYTRGNDLYL